MSLPEAYDLKRRTDGERKAYFAGRRSQAERMFHVALVTAGGLTRVLEEIDADEELAGKVAFTVRPGTVIQTNDPSPAPHCWHVTDTGSAGGYRSDSERCCFCGRAREAVYVQSIPAGHGRHHPGTMMLERWNYHGLEQNAMRCDGKR